MQNMQQIKTLFKALHLQKKRFQSEFMRTNMQIQKRLSIIQKISQYQREYSDMSRFAVSHTVPMLQKNLYAFSTKVTGLIAVEDAEIKKLTAITSSLRLKIQELEKKISAMELFQQRITDARSLRNENQEQLLVDSLALIKRMEHNNE